MKPEIWRLDLNDSLEMKFVLAFFAIMEIAILVFSSLFFLVVSDVYPAKKPAKSAEQELGDAIAKYLSHVSKQGEKK